MSIVARQVWATVTFLIAVGIAWLGVTLVTSRTYQFGNPPFETLIGSCRLAPPSAGLARLYRGDGGATTGTWYSATVQLSLSPVERQFFYSNQAPVISAIRCDADGRIALVGGDSVRRYSLTDVESHLAYVYSYENGEPTDHDQAGRPSRGRSPAAPAEAPIGWIALVVAAFLMWGSWRRWRANVVGAFSWPPPGT